VRGVLHPARRRHDFEREGRGHQHLGEQIVGIECNRGYQRVELFGAELLVRRLLRDGGGGGLRQPVGGDHRIEHEAARDDPHEEARCGKRLLAVLWSDRA
jgi:hypothetical protein